MGTQTLRYLLLEHLAVLQEGFHHGISILSENNFHLTTIGKEINDREAYVNFIPPLRNDSGFDLIWMNIDFALTLPGKHSPFTLCETLRKHNPEVRILVSLQQATVYSLRNIFQKVNPQGIVALVDGNKRTIHDALQAVLKNEIFYSKTVLRLFHTFLQTFESMDQADYAILHELNNGTAVTALPEKVLLSHSTILIRRTNLKALFNLVGKTDSDLLREVKRLGYI